MNDFILIPKKPVNSLLDLKEYKRDVDYYGDMKFDKDYMDILDIPDTYGKRMGTHDDNIPLYQKAKKLKEQEEKNYKSGLKIDKSKDKKDRTIFPGDFI